MRIETFDFSRFRLYCCINFETKVPQLVNFTVFKNLENVSYYWKVNQIKSQIRKDYVRSKPAKNSFAFFVSSWLSPFDYYSLFQLRESTLFPDGSSVEFRCDESDYFPGHQFAQEGNSSLTCHDGQWDSRIPYCRTTASNRANYSGIQTLLEESTQCLKISKSLIFYSFQIQLFVYI